jgi:hypothetical protein
MHIERRDVGSVTSRRQLARWRLVRTAARLARETGGPTDLILASLPVASLPAAGLPVAAYQPPSSQCRLASLPIGACGVSRSLAWPLRTATDVPTIRPSSSRQSS